MIQHPPRQGTDGVDNVGHMSAHHQDQLLIHFCETATARCSALRSALLRPAFTQFAQRRPWIDRWEL